MNDYNQEYFFMNGVGINYPLISYVDWQEGDKIMYSKNIWQGNKSIPLKFCAPMPKNPQLADLHEGDSVVISEKVKEQLDVMKLKDVQFIPATIEDFSGDEHEGYYIIHICNVIECMDKEKSDWKEDKVYPGTVGKIKKLVLDNEKLDKIPLEERLVFALKEDDLKNLYHRSVVEKILSVEPTGISFYPLPNFDGSQPFEDEFWDYIMS